MVGKGEMILEVDGLSVLVPEIFFVSLSLLAEIQIDHMTLVNAKEAGDLGALHEWPGHSTTHLPIGFVSPIEMMSSLNEHEWPCLTSRRHTHGNIHQRADSLADGFHIQYLSTSVG